MVSQIENLIGFIDDILNKKYITLTDNKLRNIDIFVKIFGKNALFKDIIDKIAYYMFDVELYNVDFYEVSFCHLKLKIGNKINNNNHTNNIVLSLRNHSNHLHHVGTFFEVGDRNTSLNVNKNNNILDNLLVEDNSILDNLLIEDDSILNELLAEDNNVDDNILSSVNNFNEDLLKEFIYEDISTDKLDLLRIEFNARINKQIIDLVNINERLNVSKDFYYGEVGNEYSFSIKSNKVSYYDCLKNNISKLINKISDNIYLSLLENNYRDIYNFVVNNIEIKLKSKTNFIKTLDELIYYKKCDKCDKTIIHVKTSVFILDFVGINNSYPRIINLICNNCR